jgi:hypothetical protein
MRYLRKQVLNRRAPYDQRLQVDINNNVLMSSPAAVQVPAGTTVERPITGNRYGTNLTSDLSGMIRYNTTTNQLEGYQAGKWRSFKFKEASQITQQNLGAGDGTNVYFGPLNGVYDPLNISSDVSSFGGQNLLVIVENVIQLFTTNYTVVQNPTIAAETYTGNLSVAGSSGNTTLYFNTHLNATGGTANGTTVTLSYATAPAIPFAVGSTITVTGFAPTGYNGTYVVTASSTTSVSYANTTGAGTASVVGNIKSANAIYPAVNIVGATITGNGSFQANTLISSYTTDPITDALISVTLSKSLTGAVTTTETITIAESSQTGSGYYLMFSSPVPYGKPVTVLHGFDK